MIAIVAAYTKNRVIGKDGTMPWHIPGELKRFRTLTTGHIVVMGRVTYEAIGHPLPERTNVILSRSRRYEEEGCITCRSLSEVIERFPGQDLYITGGAQVYEEALPLADVLYLTEIDAMIEGDRFFPLFEETLYEKTVEGTYESTLPYTYLTYRKKV